MWSTEHTVSSPFSPEQLWPLLADPGRWPEWDATIERASLAGPLAVGARGSLKPRDGGSSLFEVTHVEPGRRLTDIVRLPLALMSFDHEWTPLPDGGTRLTHRVAIEGPLAPVFGRVIGRKLARELPTAMASLAAAPGGRPVTA
jgi:uncharacterized protein YndB with AHSA1/START domain